MKRSLIIAVMCLLCITAFAEGADSTNLQSVQPEHEPWWASLAATVITALIGLFSRWFEKKFLQKKVTDALVKEITSKDSSVSSKEIEQFVASAFHKSRKNGTHI